ncbi:MAG: TlpA family protein disulfide reductase [Gaiellales bacterium]
MAKSPPKPRAARPQPSRPRSRMTPLLVAVAFAATIVLIVAKHQSSPKPPPPAKPTAADLNAPQKLIRAAAALHFTPTTEPGVGSIEGKPASASPGPYSHHLLARGSVAPRFTLRTPQGTQVTVPVAGKPTLLEFFTTWCPHCAAEAPHLRRLAQQLGSKAAFVSVNADSEDAASVYAFHRYFGLPYPALVDPSGRPRGNFHKSGGEGRWATAYGVQAFPTLYVISPDGRVVWADDGEQPDALLKQLLERAAG